MPRVQDLALRSVLVPRELATELAKSSLSPDAEAPRVHNFNGGHGLGANRVVPVDRYSLRTQQHPSIRALGRIDTWRLLPTWRGRPTRFMCWRPGIVVRAGARRTCFLGLLLWYPVLFDSLNHHPCMQTSTWRLLSPAPSDVTRGCKPNVTVQIRSRESFPWNPGRQR